MKIFLNLLFWLLGKGLNFKKKDAFGDCMEGHYPYSYKNLDKVSFKQSLEHILIVYS